MNNTDFMKKIHGVLSTAYPDASTLEKKYYAECVPFFFKWLILSGNRIMGCFPTWIQRNTKYIGKKLEIVQSVI